MTIAATTGLHEAAQRTWDVVVVGAGPAGALAAHELARRGCAVLLADRAAFPRWKVCGCCLNGHALDTLRAVGLGQLVSCHGAVSLEGIRLATAGGAACLPLSGGVSLSRQTFDAALVAAAIATGAAFLPRTQASLARGSWIVDRESKRQRSTIHDPRSTSCRVELRQESHIEQVAARVVVAADGLGGKLATRGGASEVTTALGTRIGAGVVAEEGPAFYAPGTIYMACGRFGYLGLVRLEDGRLDLAAAFDPFWVRQRDGPGRAAGELLAEVDWPAVPRLAELGWRGTPALTRRARRVAAERLFLIGDAAGYVEPFTGEGMAWALASARAVAPLARRAVEGWQPAFARQWRESYRRLLGRRQLVCRLIAATLRSPRGTRALVRLLACVPALASPLVRYLGERKIDAPPAEVLSGPASAN